MPRIDIEIADLESILTNFRDDHTEDELAHMENLLGLYRYVRSIWDGLLKVPVDADTGSILRQFRVTNRNGKAVRKIFPAGTNLRDVYAWMETTFGVDVQADLMENPLP